jgi:23S rRNA (uracil1939-C5)-methyltransferase
MEQTCKHFGICGGCSYPSADFDAQAKQKCAAAAKLLQPFYDKPLTVTVAPQKKYFRNKIELSFSNQTVWTQPFSKKKIIRDKEKPLQFETALGFRFKGRWDRCINLEECILFDEKLSLFCAAIRQWAAQNNLSYYDARKHTGLLRNIIMRKSQNTGQGLIVLINAEPMSAQNAQGFVEAAAQFYPNAGIFCAVNDGLSDGAPLKSLILSKGKEFMEETLCAEGRKIVFELGPQSFFQTNTAAANLMYEAVRAAVKKLAPQTMYDLYGGAGAFSLVCADLLKKSLCVESVAPAVLNGRQNALRNKAENIQFFCETTEDFLAKNKLSAHNSLVLLDPPRSGVAPKALEALLKSGVQNIFYVSCNPVTLAQNLEVLTQKYKVTAAQCFDFFPYTEHIETFVQAEIK